MKKLKFFFIRHWIKFVCLLVILISIGLPWAVLSRIDSYQRIYLMAWLSIMPLQSIISAAIFVVLLNWMHHGGFNKLKKKTVKSEDVNISWDSVIGMEQAKTEAKEIVKLIKDHATVSKIGGKILRGLLMMGPPGCGKTYLAKAIATQAGVPFIAMTGSEFVEVFVGVGASRVRQLFKKARMEAQEHGGCIIFIDEIDTVARKRTFNAFGGSEESNSTQNQLLAEMDGLGTGKDNIVVIGATNADKTTLDEALLRPGRFDRKITVQRPDAYEREQIFRFYLGRIKYDKTMDIARLARRAFHKTPSDINNIVQEAALISARDNKPLVDYNDIMNAMDRIDLGFKHRLKMSDRQKEMTAYHETGHAVTMYYLSPHMEPTYATIISRAGSLGHVRPVEIEELYGRDREEMLAEIKSSVAGYAAEKYKYGVTTTGVGGGPGSDFYKAMGQAHAMVWSLGMGASGLIGDYSLVNKGGHLSEEIKHKLNIDTQKIMDECLAEVEALLKRENKVFEKFAQELIEKEELDYDQIRAIFEEHGTDAERKLRKTPGSMLE